VTAVATLRLVLNLDVDPSLEDPHEVAAQVLADQYETDTYNSVPVVMVEAEWVE
jgi:hypothetical protein